jgi:molecular chaperone GrpE
MTSKVAKKTPKNKEKKFKKELKEAKKKAQEYLDGWKRAKADYINLKKRTEQQIKEITDFSNTVLILKILPVLDSFNQAFKYIKKDDKWTEGIRQVKKQLEEVLGSEGIEKIDTVGCKFDPQLHEAVACEKNSKFEDEIITEEIEAGYKLKDKVIRPAGVKVNKKE